MNTIVIILALISISLRGGDAQLITNSLRFIPDILNTVLEFPLGQRIAGLNLGQYVTLIGSAAVNSLIYYLNGFRFSKPIEEMVTFYCWKRDSSELLVVTLDNITTVTVSSRGYFFIIHGWTGNKDTYFVRELIDGEILRCILSFNQ